VGILSGRKTKPAQVGNHEQRTAYSTLRDSIDLFDHPIQGRNWTVLNLPTAHDVTGYPLPEARIVIVKGLVVGNLEAAPKTTFLRG